MRIAGKTGVEMEALTAVAVAALTIYDMVKAVDRGMTIEGIRLLEKTGGRSGLYRRPVVQGRIHRLYRFAQIDSSRGVQQEPAPAGRAARRRVRNGSPRRVHPLRARKRAAGSICVICEICGSLFPSMIS